MRLQPRNEFATKALATLLFYGGAMMISLTAANRWLSTQRSELRSSEAEHPTVLRRTSGLAVTIVRPPLLGEGKSD